MLALLIDVLAPATRRVAGKPPHRPRTSTKSRASVPPVSTPPTDCRNVQRELAAAKCVECVRRFLQVLVDRAGRTARSRRIDSTWNCVSPHQTALRTLPRPVHRRTRSATCFHRSCCWLSPARVSLQRSSHRCERRFEHGPLRNGSVSGAVNILAKERFEHSVRRADNPERVADELAHAGQFEHLDHFDQRFVEAVKPCRVRYSR